MDKDIIVQIGELDKYLKKIDYIFPIKSLLQKNINIKQIKKYYRDSDAGYKYLHSKEGAVHMALNYDGVFSDDGFYAQVKEIDNIIKPEGIKDVLELGCGKGFNSLFLAKENPDVNFVGIDITDKHLLEADKKARNIKNVDFSYGDFHDLDFKDASFDLIFELESICHASDTKKVLSEIYRVLKPSGYFILYEGFKQDGFKNISENLKTASILVEKSMAVNNFEEISYWLSIASGVGFKIKIKENISQVILPSLGRFQLWARGYYKYPFLSKIFLRLLPKDMVMNSIAGLLMPFTVYNNAHVYYKIILEK